MSHATEALAQQQLEHYDKPAFKQASIRKPRTIAFNYGLWLAKKPTFFVLFGLV